MDDARNQPPTPPPAGPQQGPQRKSRGPDNTPPPHGPEAQKSAPGDSRNSEPRKSRDTITETFESIIIAFILAFVFRAFIVEAFVIPSGSMAPTLLGAHMRFVCRDCGYQFDLNFPNRAGPDGESNIPATAGAIDDTHAFPAHCPNCGLKVPAPESRDPAVHYGDRILVLKYLYLIQPPRRWDVVVFKSPNSAGFAENYIKRLVGLPGEYLMILDGDVYTCPLPQAGDPAHIERWPWQIQRKPRAAQDALWRIIYDNDYLPRNSEDRKRTGDEWTMPWRAASGKGWDPKPSRILHFDNLNGPGTLTFDKDANRGTYPFTDWLPYAETDSWTSPGQAYYSFDAYGDGSVPRWFVSDLKLQFSYTRREGEGPLNAYLTKLGHTFKAELSPSVARLWHMSPGERNWKQIGGDASLSCAAHAPLRVEFTNADYRVTLRINDRDLISGEYTPQVHSLIARRPDTNAKAERDGNPADREFVPQVRIEAQRQSCDIAHLSLWRDIYYTPPKTAAYEGAYRASPDQPMVLHRSGQRDSQGNVLDNEYFTLGDDSIMSADGRVWKPKVDLRESEDLYAHPGAVPERFLLGKAFFVYWPAGYRPFTKTAPGVIPNFGELRFIH